MARERFPRLIADWSVEISDQGPSIDVPWSGWIDLSQQSELARSLDEVRAWPELLPILAVANGPHTLSSKLDVFPVVREDVDPELAEAGESETSFGLGSYIDLLTPRLHTFTPFEHLAREIAQALQAIHLPLGCAEIVVRPAHLFDTPAFGWTLYAMGFGPSQDEARGCWARAAMMVVSVSTGCISRYIADHPELNPA